MAGSSPAMMATGARDNGENLATILRAASGGSGMNGADNLCDALLAAGVDTCFANPGTSEMHIVAALDRRPQMRCILGLFEGVVTGAADGYGRMAERPAATLLHTGPGLANGLANLHNARRARSPVVNVVGDHASYHLPFDAPLTSNIESLAAPMSDWLRRVTGPEDVAPAALAACEAARTTPGVATLILPGDAAWTDAPSGELPARPIIRPTVATELIEEAGRALQAAGARAALVLSGTAARGRALASAGRVAAATGARLFGDMFIPRVERGRGRVAISRVPYPVDQAVALLADYDLLVFVGAVPPVAFFAYPGKPSRLTGADAQLLTLCRPNENAGQALSDLAEAVSAPRTIDMRHEPRSDLGTPTGPLSDDGLSRALASLLPENAIVVDEALTSARPFYGYAAQAAPHDYLMACTGGAIGAGLPVATGAAVACPNRKVLCLQADGSGMYTAQALWTQARENLDVVTVIFANRAYAILQSEMRAVGVNRFGRNAERMLSLDAPALDWVSLAAGMGVEGRRAETAEAFANAMQFALDHKGPFLIEAVLP